MSRPIDREKVDRIWDEAIAYMAREGWSTHQADLAIATGCTGAGRTTDAAWRASGYRDRDGLWDAMEETFQQHYGLEGGLARLVLLTPTMEIRARDDGFKNPPRAEAQIKTPRRLRARCH